MWRFHGRSDLKAETNFYEIAPVTTASWLQKYEKVD